MRTNQADAMEDFVKFILYAVPIAIYIVSAIRKSSKKTENVPQQPVLQQDTNQKDKSSRRTTKTPDLFKESKPQVIQEKTPVVYKPIVDEEVLIKEVEEERKKQALKMREERVPLNDEHLDPYQEGDLQSDRWAWLKEKQQLKKAFIASEILQKKYE